MIDLVSSDISAPDTHPRPHTHAAQSSPAVDVRVIRTPGLGDTTYILSHNGLGVVVDPQRDVDRFLEAASADGVRIRYVLETHVHNDYVSGARELARGAEAELVLPAGAGVAFDHTPAFHLEDLADDRLAVRPIHTPGHTPEHVSYLVLVDGQPTALFSGGSLLVGSADGPTCSAPSARTSSRWPSSTQCSGLPCCRTIWICSQRTGKALSAVSATRAGGPPRFGLERRTNPVLKYDSAEAFATAQLSELQPYPRYYAFMGRINTLGPQPLPRHSVSELSPDQLHGQLDEVLVVDARPRSAFASAHVPGSLGVELADDFGTWVGWLTPFDAPIALVLDADQDLDEAVIQLQRIGFDHVRGVLRGTQGWLEAGYAAASYAQVSAGVFAAAVADGTARQVLDVRSPAEWRSGSLPGAQLRYLPDLLDGAPLAFDPSRPVWVTCASGCRASIAAGLLQRLGYQPVVLATGGVADLLGHLRIQPAASPQNARSTKLNLRSKPGARR
jgi:rhodanese-related sulfurtransferase